MNGEEKKDRLEDLEKYILITSVEKDSQLIHRQGQKLLVKGE